MSESTAKVGTTIKEQNAKPGCQEPGESIIHNVDSGQII